MSQLLAFFPCEKVLIDGATNTVSIVTILQQLSVSVVAKEQLPADAVAPISWTVFAMWQREEEERIPFRTKVELILPSGKKAIEILGEEYNFDNFTKLSQRVISQVHGFPAGESGTLVLILYTKPRGESGFRECARYPILFSATATADGGQVGGALPERVNP